MRRFFGTPALADTLTTSVQIGKTQRDKDIIMTSILNDPNRLRHLNDLGLLDEALDPALDRLTRLASKLIKAPVALVSLVDDHRQYFKSFVGLEDPWASRRETPLSHSLCQHVVTSGEPLIIENAPETPLVADSLAISEIGVISYAGMPIRSEGHVLGSFCVVDTQPRVWTADELEILSELAEMVMVDVALRAEMMARRTEAAERDKLQQELIRLQQVTLEALSTPLIPINDQIMVMPLVGAIDSRRVNQVLDTLLHGVANQHAEVAILDITGVPVIDTQVAAVLLQAAQAVRLLGAEVMLTGIRPEIAQTLVSLGIDLKGIITHSNLQQGIEGALARRGSGGRR